MSRWIQNRLQARLAGEAGFTLVEAIISISVLAVGMLAIAQAITFSLHSSGMARQKLGARAAIEQQMELARALNYETLVLSDVDPIPHETDTANPDYWVDFGDQTYDPDGAGPLDPEEIVREPGANPALQHYQAPVVSGETTFAVYMYVTWVDNEDDGLATADVDGDTHDAKRTTVAITWTDPISGNLETSQLSALFSEGSVPYQDVAGLLQPVPERRVSDHHEHRPELRVHGGRQRPGRRRSAPSRGRSRATAPRTDGTTTAAASTFAVDLDEEGPYRVLTSVYDDEGASADNALLNCEITAATTSNNAAGNGGPSGTVIANAGAAYTNNSQVTLTLSCGACGGGSKMQFSADGSTWTTKATYTTTSLYSLPTGDGTKTIYARFWASGKYGPWATDTITVDTTAPNAPDEPVQVRVPEPGQQQERDVPVDAAEPGVVGLGRLPDLLPADDVDGCLLAGDVHAHRDEPVHRHGCVQQEHVLPDLSRLLRQRGEPQCGEQYDHGVRTSGGSPSWRSWWR